MSVHVQSPKHTEGCWGCVRVPGKAPWLRMCKLKAVYAQSCCLQPGLASRTSQACPGLGLPCAQLLGGELQDPLSVVLEEPVLTEGTEVARWDGPGS